MIHLVILFGCLVTAAMCGYSIVSMYWVTFMHNGDLHFAGLWSACLHNQTDCISGNWITEEAPQWILSVRVMLIAAALVYLLSIFASLLTLFTINIKAYVGAFLLFFGASLNSGACVMFSQQKFGHKEYIFVDVKYEWGFYLACSTPGLAAICFVLCILAETRMFKLEVERHYGIIDV